jgi:hypothetical protein
MPADSDFTPPPPRQSGPGLPTVTPPSGLMVLRMFVVPAAIVAVLVLLFLAGPALYDWIGRMAGRPSGETRSAEQFLRDLDNGNPEVRWRAASDLGQVLLRDPKLASDSRFALKLGDRLQQALGASAAAEEAYARRVGSLPADAARKELQKLEAERSYVQYLTACLGNFVVPVGAPLLKDLALRQEGQTAEALAERRRQALWALANLGQNLSRFDGLPAERQDEIIKDLESALEQGDHASWCRAALEHLRDRRSGRPSALGMDRVLEACAAADDPLLRELAALGMNFWYGSDAENARMNKALLRLTTDDGRGEDKQAQLVEKDDSVPTRSITTKPGFKVQANAVIALARRGCPEVPLNLLEMMLSPDDLRRTFVLQPKKGGPDRPDEGLVNLTVINALKAAAELRKKCPKLDLSGLRPAVERLTQDSNPAVQVEAKAAQQALQGGK